LTDAEARAFAAEWVSAFNAHDVELVLSHYAPDVRLISPFYLRYSDGRTDEVCGLDDLRSYFSSALNRFPNLRFEMLEVAVGSRGMCIRYHTNLDDRIAMECVELDRTGRAVRVTCHYV